MNQRQEKACIDNIQSYLDTIWSIENGKPRPCKKCSLCNVFTRGDYPLFLECSLCPLGPQHTGCRKGGFIPADGQFDMGDKWSTATIPQLMRRMTWLIKRYKKAGLEIEIS